jgi:hypothetical protein
LPEASPGASPSHLRFERDRAGQAYLFVYSVSLLKDWESDTNRKIEILEGASSINLRVFLARRARVARISVSHQGCLRLPIVGDSAVRLLVTLGARSEW